MNRNEEVAVLFTAEDDDCDGTMLTDLMSKIDAYWENAEPVGDRYDAYRNQYELGRKKLGKLADIDPETNKPPKIRAVDCEIRTLSWSEYYQRIQIDEHHSFVERLDMLETAQQYYMDYRNFSEFSNEMRKSSRALWERQKSTTGAGSAV